MKTLTFNVPDTFDVPTERQALARSWYQTGKLSVSQAAEVAGLNVSVFLALAEPRTASDRQLQQLARPIIASYNLEALKKSHSYKGLDWGQLDQLADTIAIDDETVELLAQLQA
ncbi:UPF0175 family protein [Fibrella sp. WM1]|uniref:UPF0175 family protein n=1 Tax=Fibrella musci TaxID=3242485 RepID=UPI00352172EB